MKSPGKPAQTMAGEFVDAEKGTEPMADPARSGVEQLGMMETVRAKRMTAFVKCVRFNGRVPCLLNSF